MPRHSPVSSCWPLLALLCGCTPSSPVASSGDSARNDRLGDRSAAVDFGTMPSDVPLSDAMRGGADGDGSGVEAEAGRSDQRTPVEIDVRATGFYRAGKRFTPLIAAGLPAGVTEGQAVAAGFHILLGPTAGTPYAMPLVAEGSAIAGAIAPHLGNPALMSWVGPDEPLWRGISAAEVRTNVLEPLRAADPKTPFLLNHAPRGSLDEPSNYDRLLPYLALSEIAAMDIYPIPEGNGHSNIIGHPGLTAIGAYTDIMMDLISRSRKPQPLLMVLLGAGLGKVPKEEWQTLERWVVGETPNTAFYGSVSCDVDGDGSQELVLAHGGGLDLYDFQRAPFGQRVYRQAWPSGFDPGSITHLRCADLDGDKRADLVLLIDNGPSQQDVWVVAGQGNGLAAPALAMRHPSTAFRADVVRHLLTGDFDGDGCADLMLSYDYPDGKQSFFVVRPRCRGLEQGTAIETWHETTTAQADLERWPHAVTGDFTGDGRDDVIFAQTSGGQTSFASMKSLGASFQAPSIAYQLTSAALDLSAGQLSASRVTGKESALVVAAGNQLNVLTVANGTIHPAGSWYHQGDLNSAAVLALDGGDVDGDGLDDVLVTDRDATGRLRVRLATSTGTKFAARDPLPAELRFMAFSALAHGAAGVVFWGQEFAAAGHVAWGRLAATTTELSALAQQLAGETLSRTKTQSLYHWWLRDGARSILVQLNESRSPLPRQTVAVAPGRLARGVEIWDATRLQWVPHSEVTVSGGMVADDRPLAPYEVRLYRLLP